jgi:predicted glycosyltransferase
MRVMIGIGHPKQAHIWKNVIKNLIKDGNQVKILVWEKDITCQLLRNFGLDYEIVGKNKNTMLKKAFQLISSDYKVLKIANKFNPDIFIAGVPYMAHVSKILRKPHITFFDTEHANLTYMLTYPFTDVICTPSCFKHKINSKKHINFNGYFELAYLYPDYFKPDPSVLKEEGLDVNDTFIIVRFVAWNASHDIGDHGFTDKGKIIRTLEKYGRVIVTSEKDLPHEFKKYKASFDPEKMHHFMHYAKLFIGESAPMSTESAILGTPSIFVSTSRRCYTDELESKYNMLYTFDGSSTSQEKALEKAIEILEDKDSKNRWINKRIQLLNEKINVTKFLTEYIESYS